MIFIAKGERDPYASYMDFIREQTDENTILADYLESERLGAKLLEALANGWAPVYEIAPEPRRFHTYMVAKTNLLTGETWFEQITEAA